MNGFAREYPAPAGSNLSFVYGGSQDLVMQIAHGAPADVLITADRKQMDNAVATGAVDKNEVHELAGNTLAAIASLRGPVRTFRELGKPGVKVVLAAPDVPAGRYSRKLLQDAGLADAVKRNTVSLEQSVRAVLAKVELGEADAGIVYYTDALSSGAKVRRLALPSTLTAMTHYYIAPVKGNPEKGSRFVQFAVSPTGQRILSSFGFSPANSKGKSAS
jgi:molybdate transport system substrate-binding protein